MESKPTRRNHVDSGTGGKPAASPDVGAGKLADFPWIYALYELGQTAATGVDPVKVQHDILLHIVSGLDAESGSIAMIVDGTSDVIEIVAGTDLRASIIQVLEHRHLMLENRRLADHVRSQNSVISRQQLELDRLEAETPGITRVRWSDDGGVMLE